MVRLLDGQLQVGENSLSLTVFKADGTSEELEIVLNLEAPVTRKYNLKDPWTHLN